MSHDNDFRQVARRLKLSQRAHQMGLHRIDLRCFEPNAAGRLRSVIRLIESEWALALSDERPMVIEVHQSFIRLHR